MLKKRKIEHITKIEFLKHAQKYEFENIENKEEIFEIIFNESKKINFDIEKSIPFFQTKYPKLKKSDLEKKIMEDILKQRQDDLPWLIQLKIID